jgi:transposase
MVLNQEPETIMALQASPVILGIDVSKDGLDVCQYGSDRVERIDNHAKAIQALLKRYSLAALAVEATNTYHEKLVDLAHRQGVTVYLISGYQLKCYSESLGQRMRTDTVDARLLARLLDREIDQLRPYEPRSRQQIQLRRLLKRRALLVKQRLQLSQSLAGMGLDASLKSLQRRYREILILIDKRLTSLAKTLGWPADLARLRSIPGIGPLTALALLEAWRSGSFTHRDPYIAYLGLDVKTKDSGKHRGRRRLTKQGNPEVRRLLFNAAMAATKNGQHFAPTYHALQSRGLSKIQALVIICRKLARLAFALLKNQSSFNPEACPAT